jgi:hypothetical protein
MSSESNTPGHRSRWCPKSQAGISEYVSTQAVVLGSVGACPDHYVWPHLKVFFWVPGVGTFFSQRKSGHSLPSVQPADRFAEVDNVPELMSR